MLTLFRAVSHRGKKYHYFLFDFCYYANLMVLLYLHAFPKSEELFLICFAFCTGMTSSPWPSSRSSDATGCYTLDSSTLPQVLWRGPCWRGVTALFSTHSTRPLRYSSTSHPTYYSTP
jgi:hypothetical protein